jgi:hypothetical protein
VRGHVLGHLVVRLVTSMVRRIEALSLSAG